MVQTLQPKSLPVNSVAEEHEVDREELLYQRLKVSIHEKLVDSLDLTMLAQVAESDLQDQVRMVAEEIVAEDAPHLKGDRRERLLRELFDEVFRLGPLEPLMHDDSISDILVNGPHEVFIERHGRLEPSDIIFADEPHLMRIIQRIVSQVGRRVDEVSPLVDARLPDGSRINAVVRPLALDGPSLSIRRFGTRPMLLEDLAKNDTLVDPISQFLIAAVKARVSCLISGGTGAGKTTLLNALTQFIPHDERLITIEDSAELRLQHRHVVRMETRPANVEQTGEITQRTLVRNSLRMRPDRILVGEVRGAEVLDMLQAMNTGHEGSLTTIHANDTRDALSRLELMVAMSGVELPISVVRRYIATGISLIVHVSRLQGGARRIMRVSEIVGVDGDQLQLEDVFAFKQSGVDADGVAQGEFVITGYRPACLGRLRTAGVDLCDDLFDERRISIG